MSPAWNSWELKWFYFHICRKCDMKYAGSLWQNYISGMFGRCCQTRKNIFTFSCKQCFHICKEYEMNHAGSLSYCHISGNVRKMVSGVVDNFLFQLVKTLSPLFSIRHFQMHFLEWVYMNGYFCISLVKRVVGIRQLFKVSFKIS